MLEQSLIVAIISPNRDHQEAVACAIAGNAEVGSLISLDDYPTSSQLGEIGRNPGSYVVFLDFTDWDRASGIAIEIERSYPMATMVALYEPDDRQEVLQLMRMGIREVIKIPLARKDLTEAFGRLVKKLRAPSKTGGGNLYAFMPAKPGSGATTLAVHCASAAARLANERLLLMDLDFRVGMTSFLFQLHENNSVLKALASLASGQYSEDDSWDSTVSRRGMLDILGSASVVFDGFDPEQDIAQLVTLARQRYRAVFVDLPGEMRPYEIEILSRANECFLVCAPDLGTIDAARRKATAIAGIGMDTTMSVIMNRVEGRGPLSNKEIESVLGLPVRFSVPMAAREIGEATRAGRPLERRSSLLNQIENIARYTTGSAGPALSRKRHFVDYFSISGVRDRGRVG